MEISSEMIMGLAGAVITLGTAYLTIQKVIKSRAKDKAAEKAEILQEAKEHTATVKVELETKISALETKLTTLEESVAKDMEHLRETYNGEIRNLGQKIEDLRSELRNQHGQLVQLLTKMIDHSND